MSEANTRRADGNSSASSSPGFTRNRISSPSLSLDDVSIPPPLTPSSQFTYNYYKVDERVNSPNINDSAGKPIPLDKFPRYVTITWGIPSLSNFHMKINASVPVTNASTIASAWAAKKLIKADEFFNVGYVSHGFTSVDEIVQGTVDIENYAQLLGDKTPSTFQMTTKQLELLNSMNDKSVLLKVFPQTYTELSNFPIQSLGLRMYDASGKLVDEKGFGTIVESTKLHLQINNTVIPDIFENTNDKNEWENLTALKKAYTESLKTGGTREGLGITPVYNDFSSNSTAELANPCKIIGYTIERWRSTPTGNTSEGIFFVEDYFTNSWIDRGTLYGEKYLYSVRTVCAVKLLTYAVDRKTVNSSVLYVSSRPVTVHSENFEYIPPPPPDEIKFVFDHVKKNIVLTWDTPINHTRDITGFQIFRRSSMREPFELISQYTWDTSLPAADGRRYSTTERVDPNYIEEMRTDDRYLVKRNDSPVYVHVDDDFNVDTEFYVSSDYIYSICSVDAHGLISNYSSQWRVTFDPYRNRLITQIVCDEGSPKQYPNMYLRTDSFIDSMHWDGNEMRLIDLNFTPEYLQISDEKKGVTHKVVEKDAYYVLQMINLDNQKTQLLRIRLDDPSNLTS